MQLASLFWFSPGDQNIGSLLVYTDKADISPDDQNAAS
jgi:hypothetical protein